MRWHNVSENPKELLNPPDTIRAVLCYIENQGKFLLLLKAKGKFGGGLWNAPGGKIEPMETSEEAAMREVLEETGLEVRDLKLMGMLEFYFGSGKKRPDWTAAVFKTLKFDGIIATDGKEGILKWFEKEELPYDRMWEDDRHWLPLLIQGVEFRGVFEFTSDSKKLLSANVQRISS